MPQRDPNLSRCALLIIDLQYATGSSEGALSRKMKAEGSDVVDYRFDRIERLVVPNALRLSTAFRLAGRPVVYVTIDAATPDALDAPVHMRKLFTELKNYIGSNEHEVLDELKPSLVTT